MHRTAERYHHQRREEQGRGDGYDEDWDDDVYYAAASRPGELWRLFQMLTTVGSYYVHIWTRLKI